MSTGILGLRPLARLAWRELTRRKKRTLLVMLMVAIPMMVLTFTSVAARTVNTDDDQARAHALHLGPIADVRLDGNHRGLRPGSTTELSPSRASKPSLPAGARSVEVVSTPGRHLIGPKQRLFVNIEQSAWGDPLLANQYLLQSGAWPATPSDVAVSSDYSRAAGLHVGGHVDLTIPKLSLNVVGIYDKRDRLRETALAMVTSSVLTPAPQGTESFIDLGPSPSTDQLFAFSSGLDRSSWKAEYPTTFLRYDYGTKTVISTGGNSSSSRLVAMQIGLVIALFLLGVISAAAFAVGAKRQLRQLGLVAANGGDPRQVGRMITLQGTLAAGLGTALGLFLGFAAVAVVAPYANRIEGYVVPGLVLQPLDWALAAIASVVAGTVAAGLAARQVRRVPVLSALGGRRPLPSLDARFPIVGTICTILGLGVLYASTGIGLGNHWIVVAAGAIVVIIGGLITAPYLVSRLEPAAHRFGGALRIAARRTARHRSRTGPLLGAIMASSAVAIGAAALILSSDAGYRANYKPGMPTNQIILDRLYHGDSADRTATPVAYSMALAERITAVIPGSRAATYVDLARPTGAPRGLSIRSLGNIRLAAYVGSEELLRNLGASEAVIDQFRSGKALLSGAANTGDTVVNATTTHIDDEGNISDERVESYHVATSGWSAPAIGYNALTQIPGECQRTDSPCGSVVLLLTPTQAQSLGFSTATTSVLVTAPKALTTSQQSALRTLRDDFQAEADAASIAAGSLTVDAPYLYFEEFSTFPTNLLQLVASGAALILALLVTGIALALATNDNTSDDATLTALGAGPGFRRRVRGWEGALLAGMGVVLAVPIGFLPAIAFRQARQNGDPIVFPWMTVGLLVVVVPLAAWAIGWLSGRTPRRITQSGLQFD